jgi:uncharacterized membrane protein YozB (DUF420 family)
VSGSTLALGLLQAAPDAAAAEIPIWPHLNAVMNATATVFLIAGLIAIRGGSKRAHGACMVLAGIASTAFLGGYLYYHFTFEKEFGPRAFDGDGLAKTAYLVLLGTHVLGAIVNLPMVLTTFTLAARRDWERHKRWARRTFPLWLYVSVTGVVVYWVLYRL